MKQMKQLHALCKSTGLRACIVHDFGPNPAWYAEIVLGQTSFEESPEMPTYRKAAEYAITRITQLSAGSQATEPVQT